MVHGSRVVRLSAALVSAVLVAGGIAAPLAAAAPSPSAAATQSSAGTRPAVLTMTVWVSGTDLMSQGTLSSSKGGGPLAGQTVTMLVDGQSKATAVTDTNGAWQAKVGLDQVPDGTHTVGSQFAGNATDGAAQVQAQMQTHKPQSPSVLTGSLSVAVANPGQDVTAQGSLQSDGKPVSNATVQLSFAGSTNQATTDSSGNYSIKTSVPSNAAIGTTLTAVLSYAGDQSHPSASLNLPLMVQHVPTPSASPSGSPSASASPTPSATPTPTGSPTPGSLVTSSTPSPTPTATFQVPQVGISALVPFFVVGLLALAAAAGLGYWLYTHHNDVDPDEE